MCVCVRACVWSQYVARKLQATAIHLLADDEKFSQTNAEVFEYWILNETEYTERKIHNNKNT